MRQQRRKLLDVALLLMVGFSATLTLYAAYFTDVHTLIVLIIGLFCIFWVKFIGVFWRIQDNDAHPLLTRLSHSDETPLELKWWEWLRLMFAK